MNNNSYVDKDEFKIFKKQIQKDIELLLQNRLKDDVYLKEIVEENKKLRQKKFKIEDKIDKYEDKLKEMYSMMMFMIKQNKRKLRQLQNKIKRE